jgi:dihydrofolate reductase
MRKVIVTEFMTLDGVVETPEKWSFPYWNSQTEEFKNAELAATRALLLGRATYEGFAAAWPARTGEFADRFNQMPKYVVSSVLKKLDWTGSELLPGSLPEAIKRLKATEEGDIVVHGSVTLVQGLMQHNLVDRYHLLVYPLVLGKGKRLLREGQHSKLKLIEAKTFATGVVALIYQPEDV